jgi:hypothetical protein
MSLARGQRSADLSPCRGRRLRRWALRANQLLFDRTIEKTAEFEVARPWCTVQDSPATPGVCPMARCFEGETGVCLSPALWPCTPALPGQLMAMRHPPPGHLSWSKQRGFLGGLLWRPWRGHLSRRGHGPREVIDRSPTALTPWETSWIWHRWPSLTRASAVS